MLVTFAVGAAKHTLEVGGDETVGQVKAALEAACGVPAGSQRWLVKGKTATECRRRFMVAVT